jgi:hypothetical protein
MSAITAVNNTVARDTAKETEVIRTDYEAENSRLLAENSRLLAENSRLCATIAHMKREDMKRQHMCIKCCKKFCCCCCN